MFTERFHGPGIEWPECGAWNSQQYFWVPVLMAYGLGETANNHANHYLVIIVRHARNGMAGGISSWLEWPLSKPGAALFASSSSVPGIGRGHMPICEPLTTSRDIVVVTEGLLPMMHDYFQESPGAFTLRG